MVVVRLARVLCKRYPKGKGIEFCSRFVTLKHLVAFASFVFTPVKLQMFFLC